MNISSKADETGARGWSRIPSVFGIQKRTPAEKEQQSRERHLRSIREVITACIEERGGRVAASLSAAKLAQQYQKWDDAEKDIFYHLLLHEFDCDGKKIREAAQSLCETPEEQVPEKASTLRSQLTPPRVELFRQWTMMPAGVKFLVDLRADLLPAKKENPDLKRLDNDLKEILKSLFNVGILKLQPMGWNSPAALLEKLIRYEAVHEIQSWDDLRNRLDNDRRCFGFFHPNMAEEPLIFVEVALCRGIAESVHTLLDTEAKVLDPDSADTAVFFSISNTQKGLAGIPFGSFLIKQVVDRLQHDLPNIKRFITLSPIPGFRNWLEGEEAPQFISQIDPKILAAAGINDPEDVPAFFQNFDWGQADKADEAVQTLLRGLAFHYLTEAKRPGRETALDPVAHFHISNGARIEQLNWAANVSDRGLRESFGLMVNYRYKLERIEKHHEDYASKGLIHTSRQLKPLRLKS